MGAHTVDEEETTQASVVLMANRATFPATDPVRIVISETGELLAERAVIGRSFLQRAVGLLGRSGLLPGEGLVLPQCSQVHMFGMRFPIDVVFCSYDHRIVDLQPALKPWRLSRSVKTASYVIELPSGAAAAKNAKIGQQLVFQ